MGSGFYQRTNKTDIFVFYGSKQRSAAGGIRFIYIGTLFQQKTNDVAVVSGRCYMQRGLSICIFCVNRSTDFKHQLNNIRVATLNGGHQRGLSFCIRRIHICSRRHKKLHTFHAALGSLCYELGIVLRGGNVERRKFLACQALCLLLRRFAGGKS